MAPDESDRDENYGKCEHRADVKLEPPRNVGRGRFARVGVEPWLSGEFARIEPRPA